MLTPPNTISSFTPLEDPKGDLNDPARHARTTLLSELLRWHTLPHSCLKDAPDRSVWRITTSTDIITLKCRRESLSARIRYLLNHAPLHREIRGSEVLTNAGVRTAIPLAVYRGSGIQCLALRHVPGRTLLECMADATLSPKQRNAIAAAVGAQLRHMGDQGVMNRDHKPSNIIIDEHVNDEPLVTVIDPAGVFRAPVRGWGMPQMLASLMIEPTGCGISLHRRDILTVLHQVMRGTNAAGAPGFGHWPTVRDLLGAARGIVMQHGNPTPAVNPLAQAARG